MKRKPPAEPMPNPAAEADAYDMLLAGGIEPRPGMSALEQLVADLGSVDAAVLTIEEFCEFVRISRATYYRMAKAGGGPRLTLICGVQRIKKDDALVWVGAQPMVDPVELAPDEPRPLPPRRLRAVKPKPVKVQSERIGLFDPPPRKPGRKPGRKPAMTAIHNDDDEG